MTVAQPGIDPVIGALRQTSDEVQLGRVLSAVCGDPAVARAFCQAVVDNAADAERHITLPPGDIRCTNERVLEARLSRHRLRKRAAAAGRVDLEFTGADGWRLIVELKIDSPFRQSQLDDYMAGGDPVAAVVRDPRKVPPMRDRTHWVGAASWDSLREGLRSLPIPEPTRSAWHALLDVLDADGDFAERRPRVQPEAEAAAAVLRAVAPQVVEHLRAELGRLYGKSVTVVAGRLVPGKVGADPSGWAGFGIRAPGRGDLLWIALRDVWSGAPRVRVWLHPLSDRKARRQLREPLRAIASHGFEARKDAYLFERSVKLGATVDPATLETFLRSKLSELAESHAFDVDAARLAKNRR